MPCHVQNFIAITLLTFEWEEIDISVSFEFRCEMFGETARSSFVVGRRPHDNVQVWTPVEPN